MKRTPGPSTAASNVTRKEEHSSDSVQRTAQACGTQEAAAIMPQHMHSCGRTRMLAVLALTQQLPGTPQRLSSIAKQVLKLVEAGSSS
jgi:hypothetical protein